MKNLQLILLSILLLISCQNAQKTPQKTIVKNYELYQTSANSAALFVLIDAHADTNLAISKFKNAAEKYGFNLLALKDVENGTANFLQKIDTDIRIALQNEKLKPQKLFIGGFSGGARMAAQYFSTYSCDGLLLCGAGAQIRLDKPTALIIGLKDFNFYEQFYFPSSAFAQNKNLLQIFFNAKH